MNNNIARTVLVTLLLGTAALAEADGNSRLSSKTVLTTDQEVQDPAVESAGLANAFISIKRNFRRATVRVAFSNLEGEVTRLHLHCAPPGANGPIALGLVDLVPSGIGFDNSETVTLDANSIIGRISNRQFPQGPANRCGIHNLHDLAAAIDAGQVYWNLHTTAFPAGELRGQVEPLSYRSNYNDD